VTVAWEATGAARDMDICLKFIDPLGEVVMSERSHFSSQRRVDIILFQSSTAELGEWTIQAIAGDSDFFEGDRCDSSVDNFCSDCDNPRARVSVIVEAPPVAATNYCYNILDVNSLFREGPVSGNAACQAAVNQYVGQFPRCLLSVSSRYPVTCLGHVDASGETGYDRRVRGACAQLDMCPPWGPGSAGWDG
jgi:hypothetical protein